MLLFTAELCLIQSSRVRHATGTWRGGKSHRAFEDSRSARSGPKARPPLAGMRGPSTAAANQGPLVAAVLVFAVLTAATSCGRAAGFPAAQPDDPSQMPAGIDAFAIESDGAVSGQCAARSARRAHVK